MKQLNSFILAMFLAYGCTYIRRSVQIHIPYVIKVSTYVSKQKYSYRMYQFKKQYSLSIIGKGLDVKRRALAGLPVRMGGLGMLSNCLFQME